MSKENATDSMVAVSDKLIQYMDAAEKVIQQYGGDAVNLGLNVLRIEAGSTILYGIVALVVSLAAYKFFPRAKAIDLTEEEAEAIIRKDYGTRTSEEDDIVRLLTGSIAGRAVPSNLNQLLNKKRINWGSEPVIASAVIFGIISGAAGITAIIKLSSVWAWVGLFWPEAYAVHKFLM